MFIKTNADSNKKAIKRIKYHLIIWVIIILSFTVLLTLCKPKGEIEQYLTSPPALYNVGQVGQIPDSQQWIIPATEINQRHQIQDTNQIHFLTDFSGAAWDSPVYTTNQSSQFLYAYIDFAGKQSTRADIEFYLQPICQNNAIYQQCIKQSSEVNYTEISTKNDTEYQTIKSNQDWYYYGHHHSDAYIVNPNQNYKFILKSNLPTGYQPAWIRVTFSDKPITSNKTNFFLTDKYNFYFKFLLLLLPLLALFEFNRNGGFSSKQALITGGLITLLTLINTLIWDLNYMAIGCLVISFSGILYAFANSSYKFIYVIGYLIIVTNSYQYFHGFTASFFKQIGLLTLIGLYIMFKDPE